MKAVQFEFNSPKATVVEVPPPALADDEVLVKVLYSALDTAHDAVISRNFQSSFIHSTNKKAPLFLGYHFSGVVQAVASISSSKGFAKGDEVFGFLQYDAHQIQGAFAEYIAVKRDALAIKPAEISHQVAAASATESITALQVIRDIGGVKKGSSILVIGASGGVGNAGVQIGKILGATVTAVCSDRDVAEVKALGADRVINRSEEPEYLKNLLSNGDTFDIIFDTPNILPSSATGLLSSQGVLVDTVPNLSMLWSKLKTLLSKKRVTWVECQSKKTDLELIGQWLKSGDLNIAIDSTYKVNDVVAAVEKQKGKKNGRVVIQVGDGWN